jgi:hypothetical protein
MLQRLLRTPRSSRLLARVCDRPCLLAEYHLFSTSCTRNQLLAYVEGVGAGALCTANETHSAVVCFLHRGSWQPLHQQQQG